MRIVNVICLISSTSAIAAPIITDESFVDLEAGLVSATDVDVDMYGGAPFLFRHPDASIRERAYFTHWTAVFPQGGCSFRLVGVGPSGSNWEPDSPIMFNGGADDVFPQGFCLNATAIADLAQPICVHCSAFVMRDILECRIPDFEGGLRVEYETDSAWHEGLHHTLLRANPDFVALALQWTVPMDYIMTAEADGRFSPEALAVVAPIIEPFSRLRAPPGSVGGRLCTFIGRHVARRLLAFAQPQLDAAAAGATNSAAWPDWGFVRGLLW